MTETKHGGKRAGAGRKSKLENATRITFDADAYLTEKLNTLSQESEVTRSEMIRILLEEALKHRY